MIMGRSDLLLIYALGAQLWSCGSAPESETVIPERYELFSTLDSNFTGIGFVNRLIEDVNWNILVYEYLFNGGGVATGDINNDGLPDIYFVSNTGGDKLYLNEGGLRFKDISNTAGIGFARGHKTGVSMADVNGDGLLDVYVCRDALKDAEIRGNLLYINNGDLTFSERAREFGIDDASFSTQGYFFDMDLDGDLDLYLVNHPSDMREANNIPVMRADDGRLVVHLHDDLTYITDRLYRNDGGHFKDVTNSSGIRNEAFGLSAAIGYFNDDDLPDIYVCNDYVKPDQLWVNNGNGTFEDRFDDLFAQCSFSSMGSDLADINNDGLPDLMTLDMTARDPYRYKTLGMSTNFDKYQTLLDLGMQAQFSANMLQLNNGNGTYSNIGFLSGTAYTDWSWSALLADFDNDGWKDAMITNGYVRDVSDADYERYMMDSLQKELNAGRLSLLQWLTAIPSVKVRSFLFRNEGNLTFSDRSAEWNSGPAAFSNGAAYADLDNDGDLDLVMNNINDPATILRNNSSTVAGANDFVRFSLNAGDGRTAFGSRVILESEDGARQCQYLQPTRGFLSSSEPVVHFGVPKGLGIRRAEITWPDGTTQMLQAPALRTLHHVERSAGAVQGPEPTVASPLCTDQQNVLPKGFGHRENSYIDFKREPLLHQKLSEEGPALAVGDVNADGREDLYLGGAMGIPGQLLVQRANGRFEHLASPAFEADREMEDTDALFLDSDNDGDLDLFVCSGGTERPAGDPIYQDRLYLNDGHANFTRSIAALPPRSCSTGSVAAHDVDGDGDLDLFVGGRVTPGRYPEPPESRLMRNDSGHFTDVTGPWSQGLDRIGMVTDARFADLNADGTSELVVVGEWMPVSVFEWEGGLFTNASERYGLVDTQGWWCSVDVGDVNGDGYLELLVGNAGLNTPWIASKDQPVTLNYKDYDANGTIDPILCAYSAGVSRPVHMRDRVLDQIVMLKKRFLRYHTYANATYEEMFTTKERAGAHTLKSVTFAHTLFVNEQGTKFKGYALPNVAQTSMARAACFLDADLNGQSELLIAGNYYGCDAQFGRYDGGVGVLLTYDTGDGFRVSPPNTTGTSFRGDVRHVVPIIVNKERCLIVARNNDLCGLVHLGVTGARHRLGP